jgi:hypothetical protein
MNETDIQEKKKGTEQDRMGQEMVLTEWDWF